MRTYIFSLVIMIVVYFFHRWGLEVGYERFPWLDIVSHSLVCFAIALFIAATIFQKLPHTRYKKGVIVASTFIVGFLWEGLEIHNNMSMAPLWSYWWYFDTVKDLIVDTLSATLAASVAVYFHASRAGRVTSSQVSPAGSESLETVRIQK